MDNYDGIKIGMLLSSLYIENNMVILSESIGKLYSLLLRDDLTPQSDDVENVGTSDASVVYEVVQNLSTVIDNTLSISESAILTTTYADDYGVRGYHYICNCVESIAANTTESILLDLSTLGENKNIYILPFTGQSGNEEVRITFYEDTNYSGGTTKRCININRTSDNVKGFTLTEGATGSTEGDILTEHVAFGSSASFGPFGSSTAGTASGSAPLILDTTLKYLITFENTGDTATTFECNINIFETPAS